MATARTSMTVSVRVDVSCVHVAVTVAVAVVAVVVGVAVEAGADPIGGLEGVACSTASASPCEPNCAIAPPLGFPSAAQQRVPVQI